MIDGWCVWACWSFGSWWTSDQPIVSYMGRGKVSLSSSVQLIGHSRVCQPATQHAVFPWPDFNGHSQHWWAHEFSGFKKLISGGYYYHYSLPREPTTSSFSTTLQFCDIKECDAYIHYPHCLVSLQLLPLSSCLSFQESSPVSTHCIVN